MDAFGICVLVLMWLSFLFLILSGWLLSKAEEEDNRRFQEEIKYLPVEVQAQLWAAKLRSDAERDLF